MPQWKDEFSFINGCVVNKAYIFFLLANDELAGRKIDSAMFLGWKSGAWLNGGDQDWLCAGIGVDRSGTPKLVAVGEFGEVFVSGGGVQTSEKVTPKLKSVSDRGPLRGVRTIGHDIYAVGMDKQVYMRSGGKWSAIDSGLKVPGKAPEIGGFESIDGFSRNDLYAVGWNGLICRFDGSTWVQVDSPTNLILSDVCCADNGKVYAVGQKGTLVVGHGSNWQLIDGLDFADDLWGLAWHQDRLYVCSTKELLIFDGRTLDAVDFGEEEPETFYKLATGDGVLCSIGAKDIMLHNGRDWSRLE